MKRIFKFLLLTTLMSALSCSCNPDGNIAENTDPSQNPSEEPSKDPDTDKPSAKAGTFKFVASELKGRWEAGDKIYVHGSLGSASEVVTLAASDISEDGKTATGELGEVVTFLAKPDGLYAAWPDEAVKHTYTKIGVKTSFSSCDRLLTVAYLEGDTFNFIDASSSLSFTVVGDYDRYALAAGNRNGLNVNNFEVEYSSQKKNFSVSGSDGNPFKYGDLTSGEAVKIWMPGDMTLGGGLSIYVGKGEKWTALYTLSGDVKLKVGQAKDLGDITSFLEAYDGPAPNIPQMGKRTKFDVRFNELSGLCLSQDGEFLWAVGDNGELAKISLEGKLLSKVKLRTGTPQKYWGVDSEGITIDPATGDLLIAMEPDGIGRIPAEDLGTIFDDEAYYGVQTIINIALAANYENSGTEGISYYKDGKVFAGAQEHAHLFCYDLGTKEMLWNKRLSSEFPSILEIAGLSYDPLTDWLWIVDSDAHMFFAISSDAKTFNAGYYMSDTDNPESIFVDHRHSCVWVGDDAGDPSYIYRYDFTGLDDAIISEP